MIRVRKRPKSVQGVVTAVRDGCVHYPYCSAGSGFALPRFGWRYVCSSNGVGRPTDDMALRNEEASELFPLQVGLWSVYVVEKSLLDGMFGNGYTIDDNCIASGEASKLYTQKYSTVCSK